MCTKHGFKIAGYEIQKMEQLPCIAEIFLFSLCAVYFKVRRTAEWWWGLAAGSTILSPTGKRKCKAFFLIFNFILLAGFSQAALWWWVFALSFVGVIKMVWWWESEPFPSRLEQSSWYQWWKPAGWCRCHSLSHFTSIQISVFSIIYLLTEKCPSETHCYCVCAYVCV